MAIFPELGCGAILLGTASLIPLLIVLVGMGAADAPTYFLQGISRSPARHGNTVFCQVLKLKVSVLCFRRTSANGAFLSSGILESLFAVDCFAAVYFGFFLTRRADFITTDTVARVGRGLILRFQSFSLRYVLHAKSVPQLTA